MEKYDEVELVGPQVRGRVIFADFATVKYHSVMEKLKDKEVQCESVTDPPRFLEWLGTEKFDVAVVNLLLGGIGPFELIRNVRQVSRNRDIKVIVVSRQVHKLNIQNTIRAGAHDFVADPFEMEDLYQRIQYHLAPKRILPVDRFEGTEVNVGSRSALTLLLESTEKLSRTDRGKEHETFLFILQKIATITDSNRTSLIIVESETNTGVVLASSDDPNFYDFPIALQKYPEILHVMNSGNFVLIEDVKQNALTHRIGKAVKSIAIGSLMVFPVRFQNEVTGVLTIRRPSVQELPSMEVLRILQALANTMAAHSNVKAVLRKIYREYSAGTGTSNN